MRLLFGDTPAARLTYGVDRMNAVSERAEPTTIALPMDCTIECVQALRSELVDAQLLQVPVCLDAAAVDRCDTAALQLILAACRAASGAPVRMLNVPNSMAAAAAALGLTDLLGLTPMETLAHD